MLHRLWGLHPIIGAQSTFHVIGPQLMNGSVAHIRILPGVQHCGAKQSLSVWRSEQLMFRAFLVALCGG
jgi:hypothetical protein